MGRNVLAHLFFIIFLKKHLKFTKVCDIISSQLKRGDDNWYQFVSTSGCQV